jgi:hypothetical protein
MICRDLGPKGREKGRWMFLWAPQAFSEVVPGAFLLAYADL